jgi:hypothetical protein
VNGSLGQLAACNAAARAASAVDEDLLRELARIDPATTDEDSFWRSRLRASP